MSTLSNKYHLNIDDNMGILLDSFPKFKENIIRYFHEKLGNTVKLTIKNKVNPRFSLSVTIYELDGVYIDFGGVSVVEQEISVDEIVLEGISDVLNDKCIVILGYKHIKAYEDGKQYFDASFSSSDIEELDSIDEYNLFMKKLNTPINGIKRFFTYYKGIFEISNWSGSEYKKIVR